MRESYGQGLAIRAGPESCAGAGDRVGEALTGESAGWVSSREIHAPRKRVLRGADAVEVGGRQHPRRRYREALRDPARSQTPCTYGNTSCGNREIPSSPAVDGTAGRVGKSKDVRR